MSTKPRAMPSFDTIQNNALQTKAWAGAMSFVKSEISEITSLMSSLGGGMLSNAAKQVEIDALRSGKTIEQAMRERQRYEKGIEFDARLQGADGWIERLKIMAERSQFEGGLQRDAQISDLRRLANRSRANPGSSGGLSAQVKQSTQLQRDAQRVIESLRSETEVYTDELAKLAKMQDAGHLSAELFRRAHERLAEELARNQFSQLRNEIDSVSGAFANALVQGGNLRDGLRSVFQSIAYDAAKMGISRILGGIAGGMIGAPASALASAPPSFDGGGFTGHGPRTGGVDGRGGFYSILHPNETVLDHTRGQGRGEPQQINITIDVRGAQGNTEIRDMVAQGIKAGMDQLRREVPAIMIDFDKRNR